MEPQKKKILAAAVSVGSNTALVGFKLLVGVLIGSVSIISEAIHSAVDLLAAVIALFSVKTASAPADEGHPFGHGKIENISGTVEALLIFAAAGWILFESGRKLMHPEPIETPGWGVVVMLVSAMVNIGVSGMLFKVARETESIALEADAWHLRTDVYTSLGVMASLLIITLAGMLRPDLDLAWLDPAAAIFVAVLIVKAAWDLTRKSARDLLDVRLPDQEEAVILDCIRSLRPQVHGFHQLRTRRSGSRRFVEFHLLVSPEMSVKDSHEISEDLTRLIEARLAGASVLIHIEPCDGSCPTHCLDGCLLDDAERMRLHGR